MFSDPSYSDYYGKLSKDFKLRISQESDSYITSNTTDDIIQSYWNETLEPLKIDSNREEDIEHKRFIKTIPANRRDYFYQDSGDLKLECEKVILRIPIIPIRKLEKFINLRGNTIYLSPKPEFSIENDNIHIELEIKGYQIKLDDDQIQYQILEKRSKVLEFIKEKNKGIELLNDQLQKDLSKFINQRKEKITSDKSRFDNIVKSIKIPLARKDQDLIKKIKIDEKPIIKKIKKNTPEEEYKLDREKVLGIISLLNNQSLQFEKTPDVYNKLGETELRDLLLANLNSVFEVKATGETFNNKGKSDIYLNIDKGNILVAECKFYSGKANSHKTIKQLIGYLSWRHNFGIIINYCKKKDFTKIINDAPSIIKSHSSYKSGFDQLEETHFISKNVLPTDELKLVEIHHLYYNLYINN